MNNIGLIKQYIRPADLFFIRFSVYKDADIMDFINAPIGKGLSVKEKLRPLIAGNLGRLGTS